MTKMSWSGRWLPVVRRVSLCGENERQVALTIDDGPTESTPTLLAALARVNGKATFFLSGARQIQKPEVVEAILGGGHQVFAHGFDHIHLDECDPSRLHHDLTRAESFLARLRPTPRPYLVRLPYAAGRRLAWVHQAVRDWAPDAQLAFWSLSAEDHLIAPQCHKQADIEALCLQSVERIVASPNLSGSVILMHDQPFDVPSSFVPQVTETLGPMLIEALTAAGYTLVALRPAESSSLFRRFVLEK